MFARLKLCSLFCSDKRNKAVLITVMLSVCLCVLHFSFEARYRFLSKINTNHVTGGRHKVMTTWRTPDLVRREPH
jgi:hypothetical protein